MILHIDIEHAGDGFSYGVSLEGEELYGDEALSSVADCLVAAIEGMPPGALAAEVWLDGVVSGTYPLAVIAQSLEQVARHAENTTTLIDELLPDRREG